MWQRFKKGVNFRCQHVNSNCFSTFPLISSFAIMAAFNDTTIHLVSTSLVILLISVTIADGLKCYTDVEARVISRCKESEGFRTCFTKYNDTQSASVTGRGCSTKDKVFYRECETHSYGDQIEKMCFCSFLLCNGGASSTVQPSSALFLVALAAVLSLSLGGISRELNIQNHKPSSSPSHSRGVVDRGHLQLDCTAKVSRTISHCQGLGKTHCSSRQLSSLSIRLQRNVISTGAAAPASSIAERLTDSFL